jgi:hypothetical protein
MKYEILAYSPSRNELQREFDEDALKNNQLTEDARTAEMKADSFASRLNKRLGAPEDWIGRIREL